MKTNLRATSNYTIPARLAHRHPDSWDDDDRQVFFGVMDKLFRQISAGDPIFHREIMTSLYLQLVGHNRDKYLLFWVGNGHNGKSLLLSLLRRVLGDLAAPLDKSVLFRVKGRAKPAHGGYDLQLTGIRSGTIDELSCQDELDDQAVKRIVSADVTLALRTPYSFSRSAVKAQHNISCSILMCYNDGSLPNKLKHAQGNVFRADTELVKKLQDSVIQDQFLNYVISYGRFYYQQAKDAGQEPLPPNEEVRRLARGPAVEVAAIKPKRTPNLQEWFACRVVAQSDAQVPMAELAALWCKDTGLQFKNPERVFYNRLVKEMPEVAKNKLMVSVDADWKQDIAVLEGYRLID